MVKEKTRSLDSRKEKQKGKAKTKTKRGGPRQARLNSELKLGDPGAHQHQSLFPALRGVTPREA